VLLRYGRNPRANNTLESGIKNSISAQSALRPV
jgi:hypothetical protein